jgi:hypothetical protein
LGACSFITSPGLGIASIISEASRVGFGGIFDLITSPGLGIASIISEASRVGFGGIFDLITSDRVILFTTSGLETISFNGALFKTELILKLGILFRNHKFLNSE